MKALRIIIILHSCFTILGVLSCKSQDYIEKYMPEYLDYYITTRIVDSLKKDNRINNFIIYQTNVDRKIVIDDSLDTKNDTIVVSYLIWEEKGRLNAYLITDKYVYKSMYSSGNNKLFSYSALSQLWIRKDEDIYKVVPEINEPRNKDIVVYLTPEHRTFFEIGENTYYRLNEKRNIFRKEYISLLRSEISQFDNKWIKVLNNEKRWWGHENRSMDDL